MAYKPVAIRKQETWEEQLQDSVAKFVNNPLGFVYFNWQWGEGALDGETGPDEWQKDVLRSLGEGSLTVGEALMIAVRSGHGIGKTAMISWIILWFMSTRPFPQIVVTANTTTQLTTKTWRELAKWHKMAINTHWFKWTATKFYHVNHPEDWFATATPWSKERSEAFAGTHEKYVLMIMDEASNIPDMIWEVAEGAMTTDGAIWIAFGNPTRNTGRFSACFKRFRHRWKTFEIDSRRAKKANKAQIQQWIDDYGEDSDFVRVRVKGEEPRSGSMQLIPNDIVEAALGRVIAERDYYRMPRIMGVDVARQGDDASVICKRQGMACFGLIKLRLDDNMVLAARVAQEINEWKPDAVFIDQGAGVGVIDRLRQLGYTVTEVPFGSKADDEQHYANKRAEMWCRMRDWLKGGGCVPNDTELRDDLIGPEYGFQGTNDRILLEKKEDMRSRGLASPDCFIAGTKILTLHGIKNIEEVTMADLVVTPFGLRKVLKLWESKVTELCRADFSNGTSLTGKGKHKIYTEKGFIPLQELGGERIIVQSFKNILQWRTLCTRISTVKDIGFQRIARIITPIDGTTTKEQNMGYTEIFGNITPNVKSLKDSIFTILTEIPKITYSLTLRLFQGIYIGLVTPKRIGRNLNIEQYKPIISKTNKKKQRNGIALKRVISGMFNTPRWAGKNDLRLKEPVITAGTSTIPFSPPGLNIVPQSAGTTMPIIVRDMKPKSVSVPDVVKNLWQTATDCGTSVVTLAHLSLSREVSVYNLTVDIDNVYYANGILVSNCADSLALSFAYKVGMTEDRVHRLMHGGVTAKEYDPFAMLNG